ncbi:MAG: hypothetical protein NTW86_17635 [Candidatus Sumerlaeota bacterium]|nr:hypothetical protein [Candidatus Sumerlaeota bacterium]
MPIHYVYEEIDRRSLFQGDILYRTPELAELLLRVHPQYADYPSCRFFLVLTQSCDLVRRGKNTPSSRYLSLAAVRPVEDAIKLEAAKYQETWQEETGVISTEHFDRMRMFVERLLDNNEPGYFYLHEDQSIGLDSSNCAFLALTITLETDHYDLCLSAKIGQLKQVFQSKLGWLIGNMYSRVGTDEWNQHYPNPNVQRQASGMLRETMEWISKEQVREAQREWRRESRGEPASSMEYLQFVRDTTATKPSEQFRKRLREILENTQVLEGFIRSAITQAEMREIFRQTIQEARAASVELRAEDLVKKFMEALFKPGAPMSEQKTELRSFVDSVVARIASDTVVKSVLKQP